MFDILQQIVEAVELPKVIENLTEEAEQVRLVVAFVHHFLIQCVASLYSKLSRFRKQVFV